MNSASILESSFNEGADVIDSVKKRGINKPISQLNNFLSSKNPKIDQSF